MKILTPDQIAEISADLTTLCRLWVITRKGGTVKRFTDHSRNLVVGGEVYTSVNSFTASAVQVTANQVNSDFDLSVLLSDEGISRNDLEQGMYDGATIRLYVVSFSAPDTGVIPLLSGVLAGATIIDDLSAEITVRNNAKKAVAPICEQFTAKCRAVFGDSRCKVELAPLTAPFTISGVTGAQVFTSADLAAFDQNHFALGTVTFTGGNNSGVSIEVLSNDAGAVFLLLPLPYMLAVGDTGTITRGCANTVAACTAYNNLPNYRGEPYVPGDDALGA